MQTQIKIQWRFNVLVLVGIGYVTLIFVFGVLAADAGITAKEAYDVVNGPLMALIGGSLAIA